MTVLEHLKRMEKLLQQTNWTRGALARDWTGRKTLPSDPEACSFCFMGLALATRENDQDPEPVYAAFEMKYNDGKPPPKPHKPGYLYTADINDRLIPNKAHMLQMLQELIRDLS